MAGGIGGDISAFIKVLFSYPEVPFIAVCIFIGIAFYYEWKRQTKRNPR